VANFIIKFTEIKRKESAQEKNNEGIQKWITKTDNLLAISKRVMKSNF